jgi:hypothetical protein
LQKQPSKTLIFWDQGTTAHSFRCGNGNGPQEAMSFLGIRVGWYGTLMTYGLQEANLAKLLMVLRGSHINFHCNVLHICMSENLYNRNEKQKRNSLSHVSNLNPST